MARHTVSVTLRVRDMERTKLFVWELMRLRDRIVVEASQHAADLDHVIDRFVDGGDDDRPEDAE